MFRGQLSSQYRQAVQEIAMFAFTMAAAFIFLHSIQQVGTYMLPFN